jgi:uncharacterized membrane protein (DUF485 family)
LSTQHAHRALLQDPEFVQLTKSKNRISIVLTSVMLLAYFGFVFLLAFNPQVLSAKVMGSATLGIPVGIGVIALAWLLTGVYVRWANKNYDEAVARIKAKAEAL